jgi:hydrogenase maturation protease
MPRLLIVAYGNLLRSDDGVAWRAAEHLQKVFSPDEVEILTMHQLGPELAESVSRSPCVIFVDAAAEAGRPGEVQVSRLSGSNSEGGETPRFCHAVSPNNVLALAAQLYKVTPMAFSVTIVGENFQHGESLSVTVEAALPSLLARIQELAKEFV